MPRTKKIVVSKATAKAKGLVPVKAKPEKKTPWAGLTVAKPRNLAIGMQTQPKRNLRAYLKWPKYIQIQRKKAILSKRLKIPAPIAQFKRTADKSLSNAVFKLLEKHKLPSSQERKAELEKIAAGETSTKKPANIKYGIREVVKLIETKRAKLVVIANDVDPIEVVLILPGLCRKMAIPYVIVKNKARLGTYVAHKTCTAIAVTGVSAGELKPVFEGIKARPDDFNQIGGGILHQKTEMKMAMRQRKLKLFKGDS
jgi:large subunit ribosomal protein L7Ae